MATVSRKSVQFPNLNQTFKNKPNKRKKVHLVFDEAERKDFITGFSKRKQQRRKKTLDKITLRLKEEKKRIKQEVKNGSMPVSHRSIPELDELLSQKEYEADGRTVSILEVNLNDLTRSSCWIGENKSTYDDNPENVDFSLNSNGQNNGRILSKKEISSVIRKKTQKSKVFKRKQMLERKKHKQASQSKKSLKQRPISKKDKRKKNTK